MLQDLPCRLLWSWWEPLMSGWAWAACGGHDEGVGVLEVGRMSGFVFNLYLFFWWLWNGLGLGPF